MPLYEYECTSCHRRTEKIQKFSDPEITACPHCGGPIDRVISAPAIAFKGGGWYADGYGNAKPAANGKSGDSKSESAPSTDSKPGDGKTSDSKSPDSKTPAGKSESAASTPSASSSAAAPSSSSTPNTPSPAEKK